MSVRVNVVVHRDRIQAVMRDPSGPAAQFVERRCQVAENVAKTACPVDQGRLRNSITHRVRVEGNTVVGSVYSPLEYARYVHEGTGIYGPRRAWIYPKRGRYLVFEVRKMIGPQRKSKRTPAKGKGNVVFARRVRGIAGSPFLVAGLEAAMPGVPIRRYQ